MLPLSSKFGFLQGWLEKGQTYIKDQFWVNTNGNFLDICVLEWCKLFGDKRGQHYWRKVITDQTAFLAGLLHAVGKTEVEFDAYIEGDFCKNHLISWLNRKKPT